jgi:hypothetical protein
LNRCIRGAGIAPYYWETWLGTSPDEKDTDNVTF